MIGRSLNERFGPRPLSRERGVALVEERLAKDGAAIVQVRAQDPRMVACLIVRADRAAVRLCRELGLAMEPGGEGVVGLLGADVARIFTRLGPSQVAWLGVPCGARETKVLLMSGGVSLYSVDATDGKVVVTPVA